MTGISILVNKEIYIARINHTVAGQEFLKRLPISVTVGQTTNALVASIFCGRFDPSETQITYEVGDIGFLSGSLMFYTSSIEIGKTENYKMIIGKINKDQLSKFIQLPSNTKLMIER